MLTELGEPYTESMFREHFGRTNNDIFAEMFGDKFTPEQVQAAANRKEALYRDLIEQDFPHIDGAVKLIDALSTAGFALAVGSSGPPENVAKTIECLGRAEKFAVRVTGIDVTRGKPDPQVFLLAAEKINIAPQNCVVFEDAPAGVSAAKSAGMTCIALVGTATREQLAQADWIVDSLREVTAESTADLACTK